MLFSYKSIILYGLIAISNAYPLNDLSKRAKVGDYLCPDGTTLAESDVRSAFQECRSLDDNTIGKYPAYFGNQGVNNQLVFPNIPSGTDLREFPIIQGGVYNGGQPGAYRVVTDYKNNVGNFRGVMQHTGATVGGGYSACTLVENNDSKKDDKGKDKSKRDSGNKDKHDNDDNKEKHDNGTASKRDSGNKDKHDNDDNKEKNDNGKNTVQSTSRRSTPSDSTNELTTRGKKKNVGSATCDDGTTLSQDDVAAAFIQCKSYDDYGVGGYPHAFGNQSGGGQVFQGVTKALREYPIVQGGTWTGNSSPGQYRVVTDYNDNFVGVMIESAGASFSRCTINSD